MYNWNVDILTPFLGDVDVQDNFEGFALRVPCRILRLGDNCCPLTNLLCWHSDYSDNFCHVQTLVSKFNIKCEKYDPMEDWEADSEGQQMMRFPEFFSALFELADVWCPTVVAEDYAELLKVWCNTIPPDQNNIALCVWSHTTHIMPIYPWRCLRWLVVCTDFDWVTKIIKSGFISPVVCL